MITKRYFCCHPSGVWFCLVHGTLILALTLIGWRLGWYRWSAAQRHAWLLCGMSALLMSFAIHLAVPGNHLGNVIGSFDRPQLATSFSDHTLTQHDKPADRHSAKPLVLSSEPKVHLNTESNQTPSTSVDFVGQQQTKTNRVDDLDNRSDSVAASSPRDAHRPRKNSLFVRYAAWLAPFVGIIWFVGACVFVIRIVFASWIWSRLKRNATPLQQELPADMKTLATSEVALLEVNNDHFMPVAGGIWRPVILVPSSFKNWEPAQQHTVLAHEFAHVKRRDTLFNMFSQMVLAITWFHPLVWVVIRMLQDDREYATDDRVIASGIEATDYAENLLEVVHQFANAKSSLSARYTSPVVLGMAGSLFPKRVMSILNREGNHRMANSIFLFRSGMISLTILLMSLFVPLDTQSLATSNRDERKEAFFEQIKEHAWLDEAQEKSPQSAADLEAIRVLNLPPEVFEQVDLDDLRYLTSLTHLDVSVTSIRDIDLLVISELSSLVDLNLNNTKVGKGIGKLAKIKIVEAPGFSGHRNTRPESSEKIPIVGVIDFG